MGIKGPSSRESDESIEVALEEFAEELNDIEIGSEDNAVMPLQNFPSFWDLESNVEEMLKVLMQKFGVDSEADTPVKEYQISGTDDVGEIDVEVFTTNDPEIFLGKYTDSSGGVDWVIRPLEVDE